MIEIILVSKKYYKRDDHSTHIVVVWQMIFIEFVECKEREIQRSETVFSFFTWRTINKIKSSIWVYSSAKLIAPAMYYYCTCYLIFDEGFSANYFVIRVFCLDFISLYGPLKGGTFHTLSTKRRSSTIQKCTRYFGNIINTIQET